MIWVTDVQTKQKVALNTNHIIAVFKAIEGDHMGKTVINLIVGQIIVEESDVDVVGML
jgi:hypothetical protein